MGKSAKGGTGKTASKRASSASAGKAPKGHTARGASGAGGGAGTGSQPAGHSTKRSKKSAADESAETSGCSRDGGEDEFEASPSDVSEPRRRPRVYCDVNRDYPEPKQRFNVPEYEPRWGSSTNYKVLWNRKLGEGGFGDVYLAKDVRTDASVVVKTIKPEKEKEYLVKNEIRMLRLMRKCYHTVKLLDMFVDAKRGLKCLVFELVANPDYKLAFNDMDDLGARSYLYQFLLSLNACHSHGIIHRDVKSRNVLFNPADETFRLIDWGFAAFYIEGRKFRKWPGTRPYRSPEMFLHYSYYDYSIDMWAFACVLGSLVFNRHPFFYAPNDKDREAANVLQMASIVRFLGANDYLRFRRKYGFEGDRKYSLEALRAAQPGIKPGRRRLTKLVNSRNAHFAVPEALDLLDRLLVYDPEKRYTAPEALAHPYFDPVRRKWDALVDQHARRMAEVPTLTDDEIAVARARGSSRHARHEPTRAGTRGTDRATGGPAGGGAAALSTSGGHLRDVEVRYRPRSRDGSAGPEPERRRAYESSDDGVLVDSHRRSRRDDGARAHAHARAPSAGRSSHGATRSPARAASRGRGRAASSSGSCEFTGSSERWRDSRSRGRRSSRAPPSPPSPPSARSRRRRRVYSSLELSSRFSLDDSSYSPLPPRRRAAAEPKPEPAYVLPRAIVRPLSAVPIAPREMYNYGTPGSVYTGGALAYAPPPMPTTATTARGFAPVSYTRDVPASTPELFQSRAVHARAFSPVPAHWRASSPTLGAAAPPVAAPAPAPYRPASARPPSRMGPAYGYY